MATKRRRKTRRKNGFTLPVAVAAPVAMMGMDIISEFQRVGAQGAFNLATSRVTGYSPDQKNFDIRRFKYNMLPIGMGLMVHKIAGKLGVNRAIAKSGIPWIRI